MGTFASRRCRRTIVVIDTEDRVRWVGVRQVVLAEVVPPEDIPDVDRSTQGTFGRKEDLPLRTVRGASAWVCSEDQKATWVADAHYGGWVRIRSARYVPNLETALDRIWSRAVNLLCDLPVGSSEAKSVHKIIEQAKTALRDEYEREK